MKLNSASFNCVRQITPQEPKIIKNELAGMGQRPASPRARIILEF